MHSLTDEMTRAVQRATELTAELAEVLHSLRGAGRPTAPRPGNDTAAPGPALLAEAILEQLATDLGGIDEVTSLVQSYANGLDARGRQYLATCGGVDDAAGQRHFRDLRAASELVGAHAIVAWCARRGRGEIATESELMELIEHTRRAMTVWRLSLL